MYGTKPVSSTASLTELATSFAMSGTFSSISAGTSGASTASDVLLIT